MIREIIQETKVPAEFKGIEKYITNISKGTGPTQIVSVEFEDADKVDSIISKDKSLKNALTMKDSSGDVKKYYFEF